MVMVMMGGSLPGNIAASTRHNTRMQRRRLAIFARVGVLNKARLQCERDARLGQIGREPLLPPVRQQGRGTNAQRTLTYKEEGPTTLIHHIADVELLKAPRLGYVPVERGVAYLGKERGPTQNLSSRLVPAWTPQPINDEEVVAADRAQLRR